MDPAFLLSGLDSYIGFLQQPYPVPDFRREDLFRAVTDKEAVLRTGVTPPGEVFAVAGRDEGIVKEFFRPGVLKCIEVEVGGVEVVCFGILMLWGV